MNKSDIPLDGLTVQERHDRCSHTRSLANTNLVYNGKLQSMLFHLPPQNLESLPLGHEVVPSCSPTQLVTILTASFHQQSTSTSTPPTFITNSTWIQSLSETDQSILQQLCTSLLTIVTTDGLGYMANHRVHVPNCKTKMYNPMPNEMKQQII